MESDPRAISEGDCTITGRDCGNGVKFKVLEHKHRTEIIYTANIAYSKILLVKEHQHTRIFRIFSTHFNR